MLRVEIVSQLAPKDPLVAEWSELADACVYSSVFQTAEWLTAWWVSIGRKSRVELYILTVRDGERLVGLLPLIRTGWYGLPLRRLSFMGRGVCDYNDAVAEPGREAEVCEALYRFLGRGADWSVLDFRELRHGGLLREHAPLMKEFGYTDWPLENCPYLDLPTEGDTDDRWKALLATYSKKTRSNISYAERTLTKAFAVEHVIVDDEHELADAFETLYELHRRRWNRRWLPGVFGDQRVRSFHIQAGKQLLRKGRLRLHLLKLDGDVQAALYSFAFHDRTCYYQGGFEPELGRYSLGSVLIANAIRQAMREDFPVFDFLRGDEEYKKRWTGQQHRVNIRRLISRSSATLRLAERVHLLENTAEIQLKRVFAGGIVHRAPSARKAD